MNPPENEREARIELAAAFRIAEDGSAIQGCGDGRNRVEPEVFVRFAFDHLHKLQRGLFQFNALRCGVIKRAVNDMRPMN